jgi:hypothetical protein
MKKEDNRVLVTFEIETNIYFAMLKHCVDNRITIDDFVELALKQFIDKHKKSKKKA